MVAKVIEAYDRGCGNLDAARREPPEGRIVRRMEIDVLIEGGDWPGNALEDLAERAVAAALDELGLEPDQFAVSLLACDDARIAGLNAEFRGKPAPTNVLSWPSEERAANDTRRDAAPARAAPGGTAAGAGRYRARLRDLCA